jgi:hypothetical protein
MTANVSNPCETRLFEKVCDMEEPMAVIHDLLRALSCIAETLDDDEGMVVVRLTWLALKELEVAEKLRGELFHLTHPRREETEKERASHAPA